MRPKKLTPIPMESIFNSRCNIRDEMSIGVSEEDYTELLDQYGIEQAQVDEVLHRASILISIGSLVKNITPVIWEDSDD